MQLFLLGVMLRRLFTSELYQHLWPTCETIPLSCCLELNNTRHASSRVVYLFNVCYLLDVCRITNEVYIEHLKYVLKNFESSCFYYSVDFVWLIYTSLNTRELFWSFILNKWVLIINKMLTLITSDDGFIKWSTIPVNYPISLSKCNFVKYLGLKWKNHVQNPNLTCIM